MHAFPHIGINIPDIFLPAKNIDLHKWSVIACDQYTSQPDYWRRVETLVGDAPSTLHLILPEVYLSSADESGRIQQINLSMQKYLDEGILVPYHGMILVEREFEGKLRHGLVLALDLEYYDFHPGSKTLIRASEQTILERIPPRLKIREKAQMELPHILVLLDDPERTVIEPLVQVKHQLEKLYDFELMFNGGHLSGYSVKSDRFVDQVVSALENLSLPESIQSRYGLTDRTETLLFATGDGNHSLATAKAYWDKIKGSVSSDHPARYALVEIENIHDEGLDFKPIHRILFGVNENYQQAMRKYFTSDLEFLNCPHLASMIETVDSTQPTSTHLIGVISQEGYGVIQMTHPMNNLPVGTLQNFLDDWKIKKGYHDIDFVHGTKAVDDIGKQPGNLGFYLPSMNKQDFFKTIILDGILPRKTFSMGESDEKRFYMECRKIV